MARWVSQEQSQDAQSWREQAQNRWPRLVTTINQKIFGHESPKTGGTYKSSLRCQSDAGQTKIKSGPQHELAHANMLH